MNVNELKKSRFLSKHDLPVPPQGLAVTIENVTLENVAQEGQAVEMRGVMYCHGLPKPMILNTTNGTIISEFLGSEETDHWKGKLVEIYYDTNVMMGPKRTGGIRVRNPVPAQAPMPQQPMPQQQQPQQQPLPSGPQQAPQYAQGQPNPQDFNDDIPM